MLNSQSISIGCNIALNLTFPIGNVNSVFWRFPQDSNTTYQNIKSKKSPSFGFAIGPNIIYEGKNKHNVRFVFESDALYRYTSYKIDWNANYQSINSSEGKIYIHYGIKRNEIGVSFLPGLKYKQWIFQTGLNFLFILKTTTAIKYNRDNTVYLNEISASSELIKNDAGKILNIAMPIVIGYEYNINSRFTVHPYVAYEFGIFNIDTYWLGTINRREFTFLSQLELGIKLNIQTKK